MAHVLEFDTSTLRELERSKCGHPSISGFLGSCGINSLIYLEEATRILSGLESSVLCTCHLKVKTGSCLFAEKTRVGVSRCQIDFLQRFLILQQLEQFYHSSVVSIHVRFDEYSTNTTDRCEELSSAVVKTMKEMQRLDMFFLLLDLVLLVSSSSRSSASCTCVCFDDLENNVTQRKSNE